jgi:hypothetical protein
MKTMIKAQLSTINATPEIRGGFRKKGNVFLKTPKKKSEFTNRDNQE